jgi:hypothetical protein
LGYPNFGMGVSMQKRELLGKVSRNKRRRWVYPNGTIRLSDIVSVKVDISSPFAQWAFPAKYTWKELAGMLERGVINTDEAEVMLREVR